MASSGCRDGGDPSLEISSFESPPASFFSTQTTVEWRDMEREVAIRAPGVSRLVVGIRRLAVQLSGL